MPAIAPSRTYGCLAVLLWSLGSPIGAQEGFTPTGFVLLVNAANPGSQIRRETAASAFLKKVTHWVDGTPIAPVDQSATSPVRKAFTEAVFKEPLAYVQNHWMQQIHTRRILPPPVKNSDEEVAAYVAKEPGGIGYVSADFSPPRGTKILRLTEAAP